MQRWTATTLFSLFLLVAAGSAVAQDGKDDLTYLIGSWICEYEWQGAQMVEKTVYTPIDGTSIGVTVEVIMNGNKLDTAHGKIVYDPATRLITSTITSDAGFTHVSKEYKRDGATAWFEGTSTMPGMARYRIRITRDSQDAHSWTMYMPDQNGEWPELMTVVYKRQ